MDIHKPHAPHSWGEFAREIGVIVIGVLIALAFEQAVTAWHEHKLADDARIVIRVELAENMASLASRQAAEPCIYRRLDEVDAALRRWEQGAVLPPMWIGAASDYGLNRSRFDSATATGRYALLPEPEQTAYATLQRFVSEVTAFQTAEVPIWGQLRGLRQGSAGLSDVDRARMTGALDEARAYNALLAAIIRTALARAAREGIGYRPHSAHEFAGDSTCLPVTTTPAEAARRLSDFSFARE